MLVIHCSRTVVYDILFVINCLCFTVLDQVFAIRWYESKDPLTPRFMNCCTWSRVRFRFSCYAAKDPLFIIRCSWSADNDSPFVMRCSWSAVHDSAVHDPQFLSDFTTRCQWYNARDPLFVNHGLWSNVRDKLCMIRSSWSAFHDSPVIIFWS